MILVAQSKKIIMKKSITAASMALALVAAPLSPTFAAMDDSSANAFQRSYRNDRSSRSISLAGGFM